MSVSKDFCKQCFCARMRWVSFLILIILSAEKLFLDLGCSLISNSFVIISKPSKKSKYFMGNACEELIRLKQSLIYMGASFCCGKMENQPNPETKNMSNSLDIEWKTKNKWQRNLCRQSIIDKVLTLFRTHFGPLFFTEILSFKFPGCCMATQSFSFF